MGDISTKFPVMAAGLQKASKRFEAVKTDPEWQREWATLGQYIRDELQSVRDFGIDVPGFDDDAPGSLIDLCEVVDVDPHGCDFDKLLSAVRVWALRQRMEAQVDAAAVKIGDESATVKDEATANAAEWSAWFRKSEWRKAWGNMPDSTFQRRLKEHGETNPSNQQYARFPIQWLKDAGRSIPSTGV